MSLVPFHSSDSPPVRPLNDFQLNLSNFIFLQEFNIKILTRFFRCPASIKLTQLKKLLQGKFDLPKNHPIFFLTKDEEILKETYSLVDLAYITSWKRVRFIIKS